MIAYLRKMNNLFEILFRKIKHKYDIQNNLGKNFLKKVNFLICEEIYSKNGSPRVHTLYTTILTRFEKFSCLFSLRYAKCEIRVFDAQSNKHPSINYCVGGLSVGRMRPAESLQTHSALWVHAPKMQVGVEDEQTFCRLLQWFISDSLQVVLCWAFVPGEIFCWLYLKNYIDSVFFDIIYYIIYVFFCYWSY